MMKKTLLIIVAIPIILLALYVAVYRMFLPITGEAAAPYYRSLINTHFDTRLDESNCILIADEAILSRDSLYILQFKLTKDHMDSILNNGIEWMSEPEKLIIPYLDTLDGLLPMYRASQSDIALAHSESILTKNTA